MNFKVVTRAAVTFIWVAVPYRSVWALGKRGYRSIFLEAGHTCQELIMVGSCYGLDVQPIDGFHDDLITQLTGIDPEKEVADLSCRLSDSASARSKPGLSFLF